MLGTALQVAETRQLKEEEQMLMARAVESMQVLYSQILQERQAQGYWLTNVELTVQQRPAEEQQWAIVSWLCISCCVPLCL